MSRSIRQALVLLVCAPLVLAGCGGNSKPGYCADRTNLENSIKDLTNINPSAGISGLQTKLRTIQNDANALVASAKSDFPSQTSAIRSSVDRLRSTVSALPSNPSATQIGTLASDASAVISSVSGFVDATKSKCG